ncbi:flagellar basal body P-ring biosynthesis protein FlgA [Aquamicrobium sp. LC103]|uniref:NAD(P)H-dependent oxidoreductase n=1 Tax=Aquamicrobium sp. LC103 TaxID=1120658 RepID=UPI00063ED332|nr:flagellar basal body P-ring biosynthesis protein FlgA [Aquamicrobium sp. LC103]TKT74423.1 flagellar biosynthesis protein FlgA [Aquamicrobium sp. LC103]
MNYHAYFNVGGRIVETCIIGTGGFGRSFLAQGLRVPLMRARVAVDVDAETAAQAMREVGIAREDIRVCNTPQEAERAWNEGAYVAAGQYDHVARLPVDVVVEATGHPEAGARHARLAIEAGRHLALVSKEVDSVVGPGLAVMARQHGKVVTPVDGDQPSLLIGLVSWAEILGFEIIAAGKSSEYDFVFDAAAGTLTSNGRTVSAPEFGAYARLDGRDASQVVAARARAASALPQRAVPDLCELSVVANACGFSPDRPRLHAPIARIDEVPTILCEASEGGLLSGTRKLDVFHCLREPGGISFAGGVFVVVRCEDRPTWKMLEEKGHVVSRDGNAAMVYIPRHLLGLEAATSILAAGVNGVSTGAAEPSHHVDLVVVADADLPAGATLAMGGHHHSIEGVSSMMLPAAPLTPDAPAPFYLASNRRLARAVKQGEAIRMADLEIPEDSELMRLRRLQDAHFFAEGRAETGQFA